LDLGDPGFEKSVAHGVTGLVAEQGDSFQTEKPSRLLPVNGHRRTIEA